MWAKDGAWLVFYSNRGGRYDVWRIRPDGTGMRRITASVTGDPTNARLSPDERMLAASIASEGGNALLLLELERSIFEIEDTVPISGSRAPGFTPVRFSPDQRWIAGLTSVARTFNPAAGLYDVKADTVAVLRAEDGQPLECSEPLPGMDWIDEHRVLLWDEKRHSAFIWDIRASSAREVSGIPGPCELRVIDAGRALIVSRLHEESDIWMLQLGNADN